MTQSSPTPDWSKLDPDRLRHFAGEAVDAAGGYHESDPDLAARWHSLAADLYRLAAWIESARQS